MSGIALWGSAATLLAVTVLMNVLVLLNGAYQLVTGKRTLIWLRRFERHATKRAPATANDCVLQGASRMLTSVANFFVLGPMIFPWLSSILELTGAPQLPPMALWPALADAYFAILLGCLAIGGICMAAAFSLRQRVRYVSLDDRIPAPG